MTKPSENDVVKMDLSTPAGETEAQKLAREAAAAPKIEKVTVDGKEVEVPAAVAAALKTALAEGATAKEAERAVRAQLEAATKPAVTNSEKPKPAGSDIETILFTDPAKGAQMIVDQAVAAIEGRMAHTNAQTAFWNSFYEENPDLKDADLVVRAVMGREMATLAPLKVAEASKQLADAAKKELLRLGAVPKPAKKAPAAEGGTERSSAPSKEGKVSEPSQSGGLSALLKERATARREARNGVKAS